MPNSNHFTILITSYNCAHWVEKSLQSVHAQEYKNFNVSYIDDNSTDATYEKAKKFSDFKVIKNSFNKGKMFNMYNEISNLRDDTIVVILDGDDWLYDSKVLQRLNDVYIDDVWMTNGSYIVEPSKQVVSSRAKGDYWSGNFRRDKSWEFSHLGSFRKKLFDKIKKKHFVDNRGQFWSTTSDQAIMWPMAEMAGPKHHRVINDVLYVYNRLNPLSDDRVHRTDQLQTERTIRTIKPYERLQSL